MKKKEKTPEEKAAHEHEKRLRRLYRSLKTKVVSQCKERGLKEVEYCMEFLKTNKDATRPMPDLDLSDTLEAYKEGIEAYKEFLKETTPV